jgi:phosphoribosylformylglycinamidine (FGAM) synthase-like enzyme
MSMQMDAYLKKEQIGTLFVLVGAPEGGFGGGGAGGSSPNIIRASACLSKDFWHLLA